MMWLLEQGTNIFVKFFSLNYKKMTYSIRRLKSLGDMDFGTGDEAVGADKPSILSELGSGLKNNLNNQKNDIIEGVAQLHSGVKQTWDKVSKGDVVGGAKEAVQHSGNFITKRVGIVNLIIILLVPVLVLAMLVFFKPKFVMSLPDTVVVPSSQPIQAQVCFNSTCENKDVAELAKAGAAKLSYPKVLLWTVLVSLIVYVLMYVYAKFHSVA